MTPLPPPGQGPLDPRGAFAPPPPPAAGGMPPYPMPFPPPPPMGFYPPPQKAKRSFGAVMLTTLATTLFGASVLLNLYLLAFTIFTSDHGGKENTIQSGDADQKIAVVPIVNQLIRQSSAEELDKLLKQVEADKEVKALVLRIDTPGGEVTPSDEMYHRILLFKDRRKGVPVVVSMGSLATSGGYYAAMAGDYLFAEQTTLTVNVGVYQQGFNVSGLMKKYGVEDVTVHSSKSPFKTVGSPYGPLPSEPETAYLQDMVDSMDAQFRSVVTAGRQGRLKKPLSDVCNGKAYPAPEALAMGAVDQIGYADDAYAYAAKAAGLTKPTVVRFQRTPNLIELLTGGEAKSQVPAPAEEATVRVNGVAVNIPAVDAALDARPMYLFRPH